VSRNALVLVLAEFLGEPYVGAASAPDFRAARDEAVRFLSEYIRIDTVNPPGNETRGAQYLKSILAREGIPSEIRVRSPGLDALLPVTITPTIAQGGFRDKVIPTSAEATLMVRPLPDGDIPALVRRMREVIDDPAVCRHEMIRTRFCRGSYVSDGCAATFCCGRSAG
jgi:acetylornithine deacetylase/succinyl-diaminopimelate desuccinylase-like protein